MYAFMNLQNSTKPRPAHAKIIYICSGAAARMHSNIRTRERCGVCMFLVMCSWMAMALIFALALAGGKRTRLNSSAHVYVVICCWLLLLLLWGEKWVGVVGSRYTQKRVYTTRASPRKIVRYLNTNAQKKRKVIFLLRIAHVSDTACAFASSK